MRCRIYARILAVASAGLPNASNSSVLAIMGFSTNTDMSSAARRRARWMNLKRKLKTIIYSFSCQRSNGLDKRIQNEQETHADYAHLLSASGCRLCRCISLQDSVEHGRVGGLGVALSVIAPANGETDESRACGRRSRCARSCRVIE